MNSLLTILVAVAKIGSLYARTKQDRQYFQTAAIILLMIIIIKNEENKKNSYSNKYNRYANRGPDEI